jgi:hypothetical protein
MPIPAAKRKVRRAQNGAGLEGQASAGATEPRRQRTKLETAKRSRYFFFAAFFLAAGFFAAFFLAAMMVYLLHVISDPMNALVGRVLHAFH